MRVRRLSAFRLVHGFRQSGRLNYTTYIDEGETDSLLPVIPDPQVTPKSARSTTCPVKLVAVCVASQTAAGMMLSGCSMGMWLVPGQSPLRFIQVSTRPGLRTLTAML